MLSIFLQSEVGPGDGTIADRYLPFLMTSLRCWHEGIQSDASGRPRWPTRMLVGEAVPSPSSLSGSCRAEGSWLVVGFLTHFIVVGNGGLT